MVKRKIVKIDEEKCNGCGLCIPACAEGALQIIDGKARLVSEKYCDGLGACLSECPQNAITIEEREAEEFDERAVEVHLKEMKHQESPATHHHFACPSATTMQWEQQESAVTSLPSASMLTQWPVKLALVAPGAPYFEEADLLIAADCLPFAYAGFHADFLKDKAVVIGCPKLDDVDFYQEKLTEIIRQSNIKSITIAHMEVPCCFGLVWITKEALAQSGKDIPVYEEVISIKGERSPVQNKI